MVAASSSFSMSLYTCLSIVLLSLHMNPGLWTVIQPHIMIDPPAMLDRPRFQAIHVPCPAPGTPVRVEPVNFDFIRPYNALPVSGSPVLVAFSEFESGLDILPA